MSRDEEIYGAAVVLPPTERGAFLDRTCEGDQAQRARLGALLIANDEADRFFTLPLGPRPPPISEEKPGDRIGRYKLLQKIGEGGCGVVYMAEQQDPVRRRVALKVIKLGMDTREVVARFEAERQALALMEHQNIAKVFDAGATSAGRPFFVMELVGGVPITRYCDEENLSTTERLELFVQVCQAIQHAHLKGIIHRDIKPSNILVAVHDGVSVPKVIDFGIAKATQGRLTDHTVFTAFEQFIGTPAYMSPEQTQVGGVDVDTRSDIYSLGVLLYELLTGRPPFDPKALAQSGLDEIRRIIREVEPPRPSTRLSTLGDADRATVAKCRRVPPAQLPTLLRGDLDWIVMKALEKSRARRYETASGFAADIQRHLCHEPIVARPPNPAYILQKFIRRHRVGFATAGLITGALAVAASVSIAVNKRGERIRGELRAETLRAQASETSLRRAAAVTREREAKVRWAREIALPEIDRLMRKDDVSGAFVLARAAEEYLPQDPALTGLWPKISANVTIETTPAGAEVYIKPYGKPVSDWEYLGKTPLTDIRIAQDFHRWRVRKEGYVTLERAQWAAKGVRFGLSATDTVPREMVFLRGTQTDSLATGFPPVQLGDFWIDKFEVTNREFKAFVDAGGYATEKFWQHRFNLDVKPITWAEAMALFRDSTDRPGPATWKNETFGDGEADFPVLGVSWFEAAAYAEFAGKRLPSVHHWRHAAVTSQAAYVVPFSNFSGRGPAPVGRYQGMSAHGVYDLAGNAKEWCWNEADAGRRYILGGGWREPEYMFNDSDALRPFDRSPLNGFRCIKLVAPGELPFDAPVVRTRRNYAAEKPAGESEVAQFKNSFSYDKTNLAPQVEAVDDSDPRWRKEKIAFNAAYNNERMNAFLLLPRKVSPPHQTVVYLPTSGAQRMRSSERLYDWQFYERILGSGRALMFPIYKGTFERGPQPSGGQSTKRDWIIQVSKDVGRAIDYLETRQDIQTDKLAFAGNSWGATWSSVMIAVETRFKVSVLVGGGFENGKPLPMVDPFNFAPRVTVPTLMLNGRYDFIRPLETSQLPMFRSLGTSQEHKRHVIYDAGHFVPLNQAEAEITAWLDRYLGRVE